MGPTSTNVSIIAEASALVKGAGLSRVEGLQALTSSGGLLGEGGSPRGNTKLAGQGLQALSFVPGQVEGSGHGLDGPGGVGAPSLVSTGHNSTEAEVCPAAGWLLGECCHGTQRWVRLSCKRRDCPVCGEQRKHRISWRIQLGIERLGGESGAGWFVGTFDHDIDKPEAVKVVGKFIRWLRKRLALHVEYASTWELTRNSRLHVNLVVAPWSYIPQSELSRVWHRFGGGIRVYIERVGPGIGHEAAKDRRRIGNYVGKWDQMVREGRGVTYSKGWPKLPDNPRTGRQGEITWRWVGCLEVDDVMFNYEREKGYWVEVAPGEYASAFGEECECFKWDPGGERTDLTSPQRSEVWSQNTGLLPSCSSQSCRKSC